MLLLLVPVKVLRSSSQAHTIAPSSTTFRWAKDHHATTLLPTPRFSAKYWKGDFRLSDLSCLIRCADSICDPDPCKSSERSNVASRSVVDYQNLIAPVLSAIAKAKLAVATGSTGASYHTKIRSRDTHYETVHDS